MPSLELSPRTLKRTCPSRRLVLALGAALALAIIGPRPALQAAEVAPAIHPESSAAVPASPVLRVRAGAEATAIAGANRLLTRLLDTVGLYTLLGDLKPMSDIPLSNYLRGATPAEETKLREETDPALAILEGELIQVRAVWRGASGRRFGSLFAVRRDLVRRKVAEHPAVFSGEGIEPETATDVLLDRISAGRLRDPHRVQGLLYGFPADAVEFFVQKRPPGTPIGIGKDRQAIHIPVYQGASGFTYVIPLDARRSAEDLRLERVAAEILAEYRLRRSSYEQDGALDAIRLINDWHASPPSATPPAAPRP
jgi:hypothetical protein